MLTLKKKGEKLVLDAKTLSGIRGGGCGQGCDDSCGTGTGNHTSVHADHRAWFLTAFEPH